MARSRQPGLIVVDRTVGGPYENILTPEHQVPDEPMDAAWETCTVLGTSFSHKPNDEYKSVREVIALLADIVSKGGNLLLGVGANAHGELPVEAVARLRGVGAWLAVNGEAIYGARSATPHSQSDDALDIRYTHRGDALYAIILAKPMQQRPPAQVTLRGVHIQPMSPMTMLGIDKPASWRPDGENVVIDTPAAALEQGPAQPAWVIRMKAIDS
jgi:alpha-L-fucosidase